MRSSSWSRFGRLLRIARSLRSKRASRLRHMAFALVLIQLHTHRVAHLLPRQIEPLLFMLVDLALGRTYQIERLPFRRAHVFQNGFAGNATIHHPYTPRFAIGVFNLFEKAWQ